jgi:cobalt-zinc-cadmium efflux system membrane fusion protein
MSIPMKLHQPIAALLLGLALLLSACGGASSAATRDGASTEHADKPEHEGEGHHEEAEGHVGISEAAAKAAGIEIVAASGAPISEVLSLYGTVQTNSERVAEITARFPGVIRSVDVRVGDAVRQGQVLATVESDESLRTYPVTATQSGVVTARKANPGEKAGDSSLFTIADLSTVWVELSVFPRDLARIRAGQKVRIRSVDNGLSATGRIAHVAALGQTTSQTLAARVLLDNSARHWVPGLYVAGDVSLSERQVPMAVRTTALQVIDGRTSVFVVSGDGFQATAVEPGLADGEFTEIRSGLKAGDRYAAANSFVLKSELGKGEAEHEH